MDALYKAFTSSVASARDQQFARTFQTLGHVVHHLQDMAQPQHTRNEAHPHPTSLNWYEAYTSAHVNQARIQQLLQQNPYAPPDLPTARNYWVSSAHPRYIGMAEFSSQNYVSPNRMFVTYKNHSGQYVVGRNASFLLPDGTNMDGTSKRIVTASYSQQLSDGTTRNTPVRTIVGDVYDGNNGITYKDRKLAAWSLLAAPCGLPIGTAGSKEGYYKVMEMGSEAGPVQIEFEAYSIPDKLEIRADTAAAPVLITTTNLVSGWHTWTYPFNPISLGTTKLRVRVTGNSDPGTLWTATVSCPNKTITITNTDRQEDRIAVTFGIGAVSGPGCNSGYTDVKLNGTQAARLYFSPGVGDASAPVNVTTGSHQSFSLATTITYSGSPGFSCSGDGRVFWYDRAGQHYLNGNSGWISVQ